MCDGPCMRSFHTGKREDEEGGEVYDPGMCNPIMMPEDLCDTLTGLYGFHRFHCPNCLANVQQCFECKQEGNSLETDPERAVFRYGLVMSPSPPTYGIVEGTASATLRVVVVPAK